MGVPLNHQWKNHGQSNHKSQYTLKLQMPKLIYSSIIPRFKKKGKKYTCSLTSLWLLVQSEATDSLLTCQAFVWYSFIFNECWQQGALHPKNNRQYSASSQSHKLKLTGPLWRKFTRISISPKELGTDFLWTTVSHHSHPETPGSRQAAVMTVLVWLCRESMVLKVRWLEKRRKLSWDTFTHSTNKIAVVSLVFPPCSH